MSSALLNPLTLLLATMCIQWVVLASAGQHSLKLPYLTLALVIVYAATNLRRIRACLLVVTGNWAWILPFVLYLLLLTAALYDAPGHNAGPRQFFYLFGCIAFAACLAAAHNAGAILRVGAGLAVIVFVVVVEVMARKLGLSWLDAVREFLTSGNLHFVVFSFLRPVFNSLDPTGEITVVASQKNAIAVCLLIAALLFRSAWPKRSRDIVGLVHMGGVLFLLLMLNTRSVIIVAGLSVMLAMGLRAASVGAKNLHFLALKSLAAVLAVILAVGLIEQSAVSDLMSDRFAFDDPSAAARVIQFDAAIEKIADHPLTGSGYLQVEGYTVHNLFLSAWMNAGIVAFLLVVCFYVILIIRWATFVWSLVKDPKHWTLPIAPEWVAPLPLLPFFRVWLSGDGGNLFLGEWIAVAAFLGLLLANDLRRYSAAAPQPQPRTAALGGVRLTRRFQEPRLQRRVLR